MIKYPIGIQSFSLLREGGYLYIDKTFYIHKLISEGKYYFLGRPRRFGKSLLLSTIEAYYLGKRYLFNGLAIDGLTDNWEPHPVFRLDLNNRDYKDEGALIKELNENLEIWESEFGREKSDRDVEERFAYIIRRACEQTGKRVVILVDEYDKPLVGNIERPELAESYRGTLKAFYANLKSMDEYIEFAMLTGVARFSKVSIFSDLNNLRDISFEEGFSAICGITEDELNVYFEQGIAALAKKCDTSVRETCDALRSRYDGYHFSRNSRGIYNPFSLMNVFLKNSFGSFWFETGAPTFLIRLIRSQNWKLGSLAPVQISALDLESGGIMSHNPIVVLYQTGYLTIKGFEAEFEEYTLDYPNLEVKQGFLSNLAAYYLEPEEQPAQFSIARFVNEVRSGDIDSFMRRLESCIAGIPYVEKGSAEATFQNAIYLIFTLMGLYARVESRTSNGRIDLVVETDRFVYIFEFKVDKSAENALSQIRKKEYWLPYVSSRKDIFLIGADFSSAERRLADWIVEKYLPGKEA